MITFQLLIRVFEKMNNYVDLEYGIIWLYGSPWVLMVAK